MPLALITLVGANPLTKYGYIMFELNGFYTSSEIRSGLKGRFKISNLSLYGLPVVGQSFLVANHFREEHSYSFVLETNLNGEDVYRCIHRLYQEYYID